MHFPARLFCQGSALTAHAHALRKIGQEREASQIEMRVEAIRLRYPQGSVQCVLRGAVRPIKRNLQWRFSTFVSALRGSGLATFIGILSFPELLFLVRPQSPNLAWSLELLSQLLVAQVAQLRD